MTAALGRALARPAILPVPAAPLRLALGDFADELLLGGQRVIPTAALESGFRFPYPTIDERAWRDRRPPLGQAYSAAFARTGSFQPGRTKWQV